MTTPSGTAFNPALHPRAGGGKFGVANNPKAPAAVVKQKLLARAHQDDVKVGGLQAELRQLRASLQALIHPPKTAKTTVKSHTTKTRSTTAKGSKSGATGKVTTKAKATTPSSRAKSTVAGIKQKGMTVAGIKSQILMVTGQIHALQQDATKCRAAAAKL